MKNYFNKLKNRERNINLVIILLIGLIIILRQYADGRSFWLDEAMLALNMNKGFKDLLLPLEFNQSGPILFILLSKISITIFGISDYSLRIIPLLAGVSSIIIIFLIAKNTMKKSGAVTLMLLFIFSERIICYTNEFKHFAVDILFSVLFLFFLTSIKKNPPNKNKLIIMGITGILGIWISYSSIIIFPVFICFLIYFYFRNKDRKCLLITLIIGIIWIINMIFNYIFFVSKTNLYRVESVNAYWSKYFVPFPPSNFEEIVWIPRAIKKFFSYITDTSFSLIKSFNSINIIYTYLFIVLFVLGIIVLFLQKKGFLSLYILFVVLLSIIASAAKKMPFNGRIILFLAPLILISIAFGIEFLILNLKKCHRIFPVIFLILIFFIPAIPRIYYIIEPDNHSEMKSVINYYIKNRQPGDKIYIEASDENKKYPQFAFYSDKEFDFTNVDEKYYDDFRKDTHISIESYIKSDDQIKNELPGNRRVWVLEEFGNIRNGGKLIDYFKEKTLASRWSFNFLRDKIRAINDPSIVIYLYSFD